MALDFTPLAPVDVATFDSEFTGDQAIILAEALSEVVNAVNNFRENTELRGTLQFLGQKPE